jgi:Big-like domain-containing protein
VNDQACWVPGVSYVGNQPPKHTSHKTPADGTVVAPGQSVSITIMAVNNASVVTAFVLSPLGGTSTASSLPAQLSMSIPETVALRKYHLMATGGTNGGQVLYSNSVTIDVERPDLPIQLTNLQGRIVFTGITGPSPLTVYAKFPDGANLDVTESSNLAFASSNPAIATVDANGMVKPVGQGSTTIIATYVQAGQRVSVSIPVTIP